MSDGSSIEKYKTIEVLDGTRGRELREARTAAGFRISETAKLLRMNGRILFEVETGLRDFLDPNAFDEAKRSIAAAKVVRAKKGKT